MNRNSNFFPVRECRNSILLWLLALLCGWGVCQTKPDGTKVLATFNGGKVTQATAEAWLNFLKWDKEKIKEPTFIEGLALSLAWFQEAQKAGLMKDPKLQDLWVDEWGALCKRSVLSHLFKDIQIDPQDVAVEVETGKYAGRPEKVRIRQIFKKYPTQASEAQKKDVVQKLEDIRRQVSQGASFAELASKESDSQTRFRGGLIGNVGKGDLDPRVEKVLFALKQGEVSAPFLTKEGAMLFWCEKQVPSMKRTVEEQRELAAKTLKKKRFDKQWQAYVDAEKDKVKIFWERFLEDDPKTVLAKTDHMTLTREMIGYRLANVSGEDEDPWSALPKQKQQAEIKRLAFDRIITKRFEAIRDSERPDWKETLKWAEIKFWSLKFLEHEVAKVFEKPDEEEIIAFYKANVHKFKRKPYFDLSLIGLRLNKENVRSQTDLSKSIDSDVTSGRVSFEEAAKKYSELPSAKDGGRVGWVPRFRVAGIGKELLRVVDKIQPGHTGPWVRQDQVLYWVKVHDKQPARPMTLEEARPRILRKIANGKLWDLQTQVEDEWSEKIQFQLVKNTPDR